MIGKACDGVTCLETGRHFVHPVGSQSGRLKCFPMGPGLQGLPEGHLLLPSLVRPVSGSPPLAGSALVGPPLALPSRGAGGPLRFVLLPLRFPLFLVLVRDHLWVARVLRQGLMWVPILAQGLVLLRTAKWFHRSGLPEVCRTNKSFTGRYQRQLRHASTTDKLLSASRK